jgi:hypothetical protein
VLGARAALGACFVGTLVATLLGPLARAVSAAELPQDSPDRHEGVATCAGPLCHASTNPGKHAVRQDEYFVWREEGGELRHARAYDALSSELSQRIAKNLGLGSPRQEALCLDCHADNVPQARRGKKFQLEDGVGCEACHGGSARWLKPHDAGLPHAENLALGLYPTDDPVARAELCLSCHFGDERKFVDHRLMGAGHPRQSFELFLFTAIQPAHHDVDADYRSRGKRADPGVKEWALGQAVAVREILAALLDPKRGRDGIWPEFVLFDCHACHHPMSNTRWRPRASTGLGPGVARLNDASFLMLRVALETVAPDAARSLATNLRALHAAASGGAGDVGALARRMQGEIANAIRSLEAWRVDAAALAAVSARLVAEGTGGEYADYGGAEQATIALQILLDARASALGSRLAKAEKLIGEMVDGVQSPEKFDPARLRKQFEQLAPLFR